ncbi:hypothetical protein IIA79_03475 [bacterium]|nr:hypothetical protein [bacterium]
MALGVAYFLLNLFVLNYVRASLVEKQITGQKALALTIRDVLSEAYSRGEDIDSLLNKLALTYSPEVSGGSVSVSVLASDGRQIAGTPGSPLSFREAVDAFSIRDPVSGASVSFSQSLQMDQPASGLVYGVGGKPSQMTVASAKMNANGWLVLVFEGTKQIEESMRVTKLYLLVSFLSLSMVLMVLILASYLSLARTFSSSVQVVAAMEEAAQSFQENIGVMHRPLTNIQGLADMLSITEDSFEREGYLGEIKKEVKELIKMIQESER